MDVLHALVVDLDQNIRDGHRVDGHRMRDDRIALDEARGHHTKDGWNAEDDRHTMDGRNDQIFQDEARGHHKKVDQNAEDDHHKRDDHYVLGVHRDHHMLGGHLNAGGGLRRMVFHRDLRQDVLPGVLHWSHHGHNFRVRVEHCGPPGRHRMGDLPKVDMDVLHVEHHHDLHNGDDHPMIVAGGLRMKDDRLSAGDDHHKTGDHLNVVDDHHKTGDHLNVVDDHHKTGDHLSAGDDHRILGDQNDRDVRHDRHKWGDRNGLLPVVHHAGVVTGHHGEHHSD
ncbi:MAG: hypothetical protein RLZZ52_145 [Actinomycetota bacterium]